MSLRRPASCGPTIFGARVWWSKSGGRESAAICRIVLSWSCFIFVNACACVNVTVLYVSYNTNSSNNIYIYIRPNLENIVRDKKDIENIIFLSAFRTRGTLNRADQ
jgi:hypothetical protein